ncbi:hypothetical protein [Cysteiniphilum sp. 6C5]|uniref:hypothetical protein n=1 Tax=unclassified Cysteiniphilum TaxID=2610889 RepID=UPI003F8558C2
MYYAIVKLALDVSNDDTSYYRNNPYQFSGRALCIYLLSSTSSECSIGDQSDDPNPPVIAVIYDAINEGIHDNIDYIDLLVAANKSINLPLIRNMQLIENPYPQSHDHYDMGN